MSLIKANAVQVGQSPTATQNFTLAVPSSPDGTIKLARGNAGATTQDVMNVSNAGVVSFPQGLGNISNSTAIATGSTTARSLANRFADVVNVKDFGAVGDGVADDTAAIQAAIDISSTQNRSLLFPKGVYGVTTIFTNKQCCTWYFQQAELKGIASTATDCIVKFDGVRCMIYGMVLNVNKNTNYVCALNWYDATASSQYNNFFGLSILFAKKGIIYGPITGSSTGFAQSENAIFGYTSYGVWVPVTMNHSNGVLFFSGSQLVAHNDGWGVLFDNTQNFAFDAIAGVLVLEGSELQNSIANTSSFGAIVNGIGAEVYLNGCITEFNVPFRISGNLRINGGRVINTQSLTDMFYFPTTANSLSKLYASEVYFYRPNGTGSFSARNFVNNTGAASTIEITFDNCQIWDWANFVPLVSDNNQSATFNKCRWYPDGTQNANLEVYLLDTKNSNLIDKQGIDFKGYTTDGFYGNTQFGGFTFALNADVPNSFYEKSLSVIPLGQAGVFTIDPTSLATIKSTGFIVKQFDKFVIEGWFRKVTSGTAFIGMAAYDSSGTLLVSGFIPSTSSLQSLTTSWKYIRTTVSIPSGSSAAYVGFGIYGNVTEVRMCGLKISRANWNQP
jgi:hypothetical protein